MLDSTHFDTAATDVISEVLLLSRRPPQPEKAAGTGR